VWLEIDNGIAVIDNCLKRTELEQQFHQFCRQLYSEVAKSLGWDPKPDEGHTVGMLRPLVLRRLGLCGDEATTIIARTKFRAFVDEGQDMTPDLRSMVFGLVALNDGEKAQKELIKIFENSDFSEIQRQCLVSIGRSRDIRLQKMALEYALSKKVRSQDSYLVIAGVATSLTGQETAWAYFKYNMGLLVNKFGSANSGLFTAIIKMVVSGHCSEEKATEIEDFFKGHNDVWIAANRPIQQSLETVRLNSDLLKRDTDAIKTFLAKA